ncbi:MAG: DUF2000 family protein [Solirubrobacteraceae bacterium]
MAAVTDFETKTAVVVRDDLAAWQRLNVCAFLMSGVTAAAGNDAIGEDYLDADGNHYLPLLVQPVLVYEGSAEKLKTVRERAFRRAVPIALYTLEMFSTGNDTANRAAVRAVAAAELDVVGVALRVPHRDADAVLRGLSRHP